jgi:hypothetical protein
VRLRRTRAVQNRALAQLMRSFYDGRTVETTDPLLVAKDYAGFVRENGVLGPLRNRWLDRSKYSVSLGLERSSLAECTKRTALVADTLLLSHGPGCGDAHELVLQAFTSGVEVGYWNPGTGDVDYVAVPLPHGATRYWYRCPSPQELGRWIVDSRPLMEAGLVCYLPSYLERQEIATDYSSGWRPDGELGASRGAFDFLVRDGRAVEMSGCRPILSRLVRPILEIDLPFVDDVGMADFSRITVGEFDSYRALRGFLRQAFFDLDAALDAEQMDLALARIGEEIADEVRGVASRMRIAKRKRAVSLSGAAIGTVTAALVAVYGPALEDALAILGIGAGAGGAWELIKAGNEHNPRSVDGAESWYYVWALQRQARQL